MKCSVGVGTGVISFQICTTAHDQSDFEIQIKRHRWEKNYCPNLTQIHKSKVYAFISRVQVRISPCVTPVYMNVNKFEDPKETYTHHAEEKFVFLQRKSYQGCVKFNLFKLTVCESDVLF